jgi:hypothetical protein
MAPVADGNPFLYAPYRTADGRDIFSLAVYPHLERKWLSFLQCGPAVDQVSAYDRARKVAFLDSVVSVSWLPDMWLSPQSPDACPCKCLGKATNGMRFCRCSQVFPICEVSWNLPLR